MSRRSNKHIISIYYMDYKLIGDIPRGPTIHVSKFAPGFMLYMGFRVFNIEIIHELASNFLDICSSTAYPFGFISKIKRPSIDILKFLVAKKTNQDIKVAFILVGENGALEKSSESMETCRNMNVTLQNTGGDVSSLNGKNEIPNKTLANKKISLLLNLNHKKEHWCFIY